MSRLTIEERAQLRVDVALCDEGITLAPQTVKQYLEKLDLLDKSLSTNFAELESRCTYYKGGKL